MKKLFLSLLMLFSVLLFSTQTYADCPSELQSCMIMHNGSCQLQGDVYAGTCWSWAAMSCWSCNSASDDCNAKFSTCDGKCMAMTSGMINGMCDQGVTDARKK